jgi:hypothetical protein
MIPAHLYGLNQFLGINWRFGGPQTWPDLAAVPSDTNACALQAIREHCFSATAPRAGVKSSSGEAAPARFSPTLVTKKSVFGEVSQSGQEKNQKE